MTAEHEHHAADADAPAKPPAKPGDRVTDPVCGMLIDAGTARGGSHAHAGQTFYFCNPRCREKFAADPARYLPPAPGHAVAHAAAPSVALPAETTSAAVLPAQGPGSYVCPMHPEVVRDQPGACPICGMALEPRHVTLDEPANPELADMQRRFWLSLALSLPRSCWPCPS